MLKILFQDISPMFYFLLILATYAMFYFFFGEIIPVNNGLGWDGSIYGQMAKDFYNYVIVGHINYYYVQRILPSGIIHFLLKFFNIPFSDLVVIKGFQFYNILLLLTSTILWHRICSILKLPNNLQWLAYISLYINFAILKQSFYYPVLTDTTALFLGILLLYFFLKNNSWGIILATLAIGFTWPIALMCSLFLFIFPYSYSTLLIKNCLNKTFTFVLSLLFVFIFLLLTFLPYSKKIFHIYPDNNIAHIDPSLIGISLISGATYFYYGFKIAFVNFYFHWKTLLKQFKFYRLFFFILLMITIYYIVHFIGSYNPGSLNIYYFINSIFYLASVKPFVFLVAHFIYYGPIIICTILVWNKVMKTVSKYGLGLVILFFSFLFLSINSESREQIFSFPFVVAFTIKSLENFKLSKSFYIIYLTLSVCVSKFFITINKAPFTGSFLDFPYQYYYMNQGPWMSLNAYILQGIGFVITFIILSEYLFNKAAPKNTTTN